MRTTCTKLEVDIAKNGQVMATLASKRPLFTEFQRFPAISRFSFSFYSDGESNVLVSDFRVCYEKLTQKYVPQLQIIKYSYFTFLGLMI